MGQKASCPGLPSFQVGHGAASRRLGLHKARNCDFDAYPKGSDVLM